MTSAGLAQLDWSATFRPFGEAHAITGTESLALRLPGQLLDPETGFHQNWHRDYDPRLGRYLQSDPIGLDGGLNTYAYVGGNPIGRIDPTGENPASGAVWGGNIGTGVGGALGGPVGALVGRVLGTGVGAGAGYLACKILNATHQVDEAGCKEQLDRDTATCRAVATQERRGQRSRGAAARCYESAHQRYANCLTGLPLGPLDTWNN
jgi:RHS repeat-associated protein